MEPLEARKTPDRRRHERLEVRIEATLHIDLAGPGGGRWDLAASTEDVSADGLNLLAPAFPPDLHLRLLTEVHHAHVSLQIPSEDRPIDLDGRIVAFRLHELVPGEPGRACQLRINLEPYAADDPPTRIYAEFIRKIRPVD